MTKVYVFQDGTLASQLLQAELRERDLDLDVKVVDSEDVIDWFTKIEPDQKIYLHFCYEDYIKDNEKLRRELSKLEHLGFRNLIVREYEGLDKKTMEQRCKDRGFKHIKPEWTEKHDKIVEIEYDKKYLGKLGDSFTDKSNVETTNKVMEEYNEDDKPVKKRRMFKL